MPVREKKSDLMSFLLVQLSEDQEPTIYSRSMKGLQEFVEHVHKSASRHSLVDSDDFNILQLESIAVNNTANAT